MLDLTDNPYVVADPQICHGKLTFRGTRIFVKDVLDMVAADVDWDKIVEDWRGSVSKEAIAEAVRLATVALVLSAKPVADLAVASG